ncbi:MAG: hypothetical protein ACI92Z_002949 [Paracoccaceae bacterium]
MKKSRIDGNTTNKAAIFRIQAPFGVILLNSARKLVFSPRLTGRSKAMPPATGVFAPAPLMHNRKFLK